MQQDKTWDVDYSPICRSRRHRSININDADNDNDNEINNDIYNDIDNENINIDNWIDTDDEIDTDNKIEGINIAVNDNWIDNDNEIGGINIADNGNICPFLEVNDLLQNCILEFFNFSANVKSYGGAAAR